MKALVTMLTTLLLATAAIASAQTAAEVDTALRRLEGQLARLEAGEADVDGYALFGEQPPGRYLTGDPLEDQFVSSPARIEVLRHQILGLREIRDWLSRAGDHDDGGEPLAVTVRATDDGNVYAYTYRNWNRANLGAYEQMPVGYHHAGGEKRAYVRFDVPDVGPVDRAVLRLHHAATSGAGDLALAVHRVIGPWAEGADTYHSGQVERTAAPGELSWEQQPAFDPNPVTTFRPGAPPSWLEIDVTPAVNDWLRGAPNHGLMIAPVPPLSGITWYAFPTKEDPEGRGPRLGLYRDAVE